MAKKGKAPKIKRWIAVEATSPGASSLTKRPQRLAETTQGTNQPALRIIRLKKPGAKLYSNNMAQTVLART